MREGLEKQTLVKMSSLDYIIIAGQDNQKNKSNSLLNLLFI